MQDTLNKITAGEQLTTKETEEVLDFMDETADAISAAASDGKVNWMDIPKLLKVVKSADPALRGVAKVWPELKDLDEAEVGALMGRLTTTVAKWAEAIAALGSLKD